ncbi:MAG: adenylosuccinate synthetase, partial [Chloroflexi bacterium]
MLDLDFGTYPYVTSSNPTAGGALTGSGIAPTRVDQTVVVVKGYTSRVGYGPFPTELLDDLGELIRERGREYGTVTGRARRVGWFDGPVARYSTRLNGATSVALMKVDVLSEVETLKLCTGYRFRGEVHDHPMANISHLKHCEPVWSDLPRECRDYVERVGEVCGAPVDLIGVGPHRDQLVMRRPILFQRETAAR